ncbi:PREDICTED: calmodulin-like protein 2 [Camelina sativa]|uniref:Calmodulin-like protein 2 n=1 Tax=Camelina sativa TaxID=90675 RepID=A0ABM1QQS7_CAMSA|nr:PREDICTED: calmodulin-like protein 2 [Camelina sativa]
MSRGSSNAFHEIERSITNAFRSADLNGSGKLGYHEFRRAIQAMKLMFHAEEVGHLLATHDLVGDGTISRESFIEIFKPSYKEAALLSAFASNKTDDDGFLGLKQLRLALIHLGLNLSEVEAYNLSRRCNDATGAFYKPVKVSFRSFCKLTSRACIYLHQANIHPGGGIWPAGMSL